MGWELGRHAGELFWFVKGLLKTKEKDWNPLQNIADAWQVVEKIKEQTYFFVLSYAEDNEKYAWQADFDDVSVQKISTGMTEKYPGINPGAVDGGLVDFQLFPGKRNRIRPVFKDSYLLPHVEHHCFVLVIDPNVDCIPITRNFPAFDFLIVGIKCDDNQNKVIR